jgi:hypothetical protein
MGNDFIFINYTYKKIKNKTNKISCLYLVSFWGGLVIRKTSSVPLKTHENVKYFRLEWKLCEFLSRLKKKQKGGWIF